MLTTCTAFMLIRCQLNKDEIPGSVWDDALVVEKSNEDEEEEITQYHRMDIIWGFFRKVFPSLSKVALAVLTIPHSNAGEERVCSMIRKNKTEFRPRLDSGTSLDSIMSIKMNCPENLNPCHKFKPSKELLKKCKSACREYNLRHTS